MHWAKAKEVIVASVMLGLSMEERNFIGLTALHLMVKRNIHSSLARMWANCYYPRVVRDRNKSESK